MMKYCKAASKLEQVGALMGDNKEERSHGHEHDHRIIRHKSWTAHSVPTGTPLMSSTHQLVSNFPIHFKWTVESI